MGKTEKKKQKIMRKRMKIGFGLLAAFLVIAASVLAVKAAFLTNTSVETANADEATSTPQFVIFAFDGSKSLKVWRDTLQFSRDLADQNIDLKFTYFINSVYLVSEANKDMYKPPHVSAGKSAVGFASGPEDVEQRMAYINQAFREGHEIGSHAAGHWDGSKWSEAEWQKEIASYFDQLFNAASYNPGISSRTKPAFFKNDIAGFRAPNLGRNDHMYKVLKDFSFRYDTSTISDGTSWPAKDQNGLWLFPLSTMEIMVNGKKYETLSMDYNVFYLQSKAEDKVLPGTDEWQNDYTALYEAYMNYFEKHYNGNRAPVHIGHHFSEWNGGVYWRVMKDVAKRVCGLKDVRCATYSELADYMDARPEMAGKK